MAQAQDTVWLPVLPSMKGFGPALVKGAGSEADKAGASIGKRLGTGIAAGATAVVATVGVLAKVGSVFSDVSSTISTGTGVAGADLERLNGVAKRVGSSIPASFDTIADAVVAVQSSLGGFSDMTEAEFDQATTNALNFSKRFEVDTARVTQVVGQMMKTGLVGDANEAFDLLVSAAQKVPQAVREDVLDAVDEYGPFFTQLGIKGADAMGMLVAASEKGMYGIDKTGDALKEFTIRATDMSKATSTAYDALGLDTVAMTESLLAGGETGAAAFQKIVKSLHDMEDPVAQSQAALALFGTPLEDLGTKDIPKFIASLAGGESALGDFGGAAARMGDELNNSMGARLEVLRNKVMVWFEPLASQVLGGLITLFDEVNGGVTAFGAAFSDAGTEVTSGGFAGVLETIGLGLGGIWALISRGDFNGKLVGAFGWEEDHPLVSFLLTARDAINDLWSGLSMNSGVRAEFAGQLEGLVKSGAGLREAFEDTVSTGGKVISWLKDMKDPIAVVSGLIITALIPHWIALGVTAVSSATSQKLAWGMTQASAAKAAFVHSWAVTAMAGGWVLMGAAAIKSGAETAAIWLMYQWESVKAVASMVAARVAIVAGWVMMGAQATLNAAKMAAAWVIALGPVGWVIGAVVGLGAAFIAAYENIGWFRDGVDTALRAVGGFFSWLWTDVIQPVFGFIQDAIGAVGNWFTGTAVPAFQSAIAFLAGIFVSFYESTLKPVFDSAGVIINGFYLFFRGIGQLVASIVVNILVPLFLMFWDQVVTTFNGILSAVGGWWNGVVGIFNDVVAFIQTVLAAVFTWLLDSVIRPVVTAIGDAALWLWNSVLKPTFDAWVHFFTVVIPQALNWLYQNAIKPVFDAIGQVVAWVWNNVISPYLNFWIDFFMNKIPAAARWLYENGIKPVFDSIGNAIKWVWETIIRPVFDALSNFMTKNIPDAFNNGVDFIKKAWDRLIDIAKMPVRFVVDTVINDGLIGAFNNIANVLPGVDKLPRVALPAGFARGGVLPGYESRKRDTVLTPMRPGEGVLVPEVVRAAGRGFIDVLNAAGNRGVGAVRKLMDGGLLHPGRALGGLIHPLRASTVSQPFHGGHNGIDFAAPTGTPIAAAGPGRVSAAGWSSYGGGNEIHIDHPNGLQTWYAHLSSFAVRLGEMVRAGTTIGKVGSTGNSTGPHLHYMVMNGGWPNFVNPAAYLDGGGEAGQGWNPIAGIIDGLIGKFKEAFPAAGIMADIAIGVGRKLLTDVSDVITGGGGRDNGIGETGLPYLHDQGGVLHPGLSTVLNATRKPEAILNSQQWADIHQLAARGAAGAGTGGDVHVHGNVGWMPDQLAREIEVQKRRSQTMAGMDGVVFA